MAFRIKQSSSPLRSPQGVRLTALALAVLGALAAFAALGTSEWFGAGTQVVEAAMPGMATVSGTVTAPGAFTAARVYLRNTEKQITYMVYTQGGKFRATPLFPGNYQISVLTKGLVSDTQNVSLKEGANTAITLAMRAGAGREPVGAQASGDSEADTNLTAGVTAEGSYDELYPPGP